MRISESLRQWAAQVLPFITTATCAFAILSAGCAMFASSAGSSSGIFIHVAWVLLVFAVVLAALMVLIRLAAPDKDDPPTIAPESESDRDF